MRLLKENVTFEAIEASIIKRLQALICDEFKDTTHDKFDVQESDIQFVLTQFMGTLQFFDYAKLKGFVSPAKRYEDFIHHGFWFYVDIWNEIKNDVQKYSKDYLKFTIIETEQMRTPKNAVKIEISLKPLKMHSEIFGRYKVSQIFVVKMYIDLFAEFESVIEFNQSTLNM